MRTPKDAPNAIGEFAQRAPELPERSASTIPRKRGTTETVGLTLRLSRSQWEKIHGFALQRGTSINQLAIAGIAKLFAEAGLSLND